jgi:D-sedoheptulose 7-phosphate isomerase
MEPRGYFERVQQFAYLLAELEITDQGGRPIAVEQGFSQACASLASCDERKGTVFVIGSGGSAALACHAVTDLVNACHLRAFTLSDPALLTCMSNDYGYDQSYATMLGNYGQAGDLLLAISSSGGSPAIHHAVNRMRSLSGTTITLSGFSPDNGLRRLGDLNFWLPCRQFGPVEIGHGFLLHEMTDRVCAARGLQVAGPLALRQKEPR